MEAEGPAAAPAAAPAGSAAGRQPRTSQRGMLARRAPPLQLDATSGTVTDGDSGGALGGTLGATLCLDDSHRLGDSRRLGDAHCRARPQTHGGHGRRPMMLNLSGSLSSLKTTLTDAHALRPGTPLPERNEYRNITGKVDVIMFDFDGTLTSTPGDRQVRSRKRAEIIERAVLLRPWLQSLREAVCLMGVISKSTEGTIRDALGAGGLASFFEAPIVGKAIGFEGKVGFIQDMARRGVLRRPGERRPGPPLHRILLVDDDVLELERANAKGLQTYAAPGEGGLQEGDFAAIHKSLQMPACTSPPPRKLNNMPGMLTATMELLSTGSDSSPMMSPSKNGGRWRNLILFSGECFEG